MSTNFKDFCEDWIYICERLDREQSDKYKRAREKGKEFKEIFSELLSHFVPNGYKILRQKKVEGVDHKFNFLFVKTSASEYGDLKPSNVMAVVDAKSHGFFGYSAIYEMKSTFETVKRKYPHIKLFYVTFRETDTYDEKFREVFGQMSQHYYRLSDSGDGVQMPPKRYFPNEWDRLIRDLSSLKTT
ncbi:MAG: hypothetical protein QXZ70_03320 [Candidatus Bathyarchaeia archaeon]